jgi:hypothetical protein
MIVEKMVKARKNLESRAAVDAVSPLLSGWIERLVKVLEDENYDLGRQPTYGHPEIPQSLEQYLILYCMQASVRVEHLQGH